MIRFSTAVLAVFFLALAVKAQDQKPEYGTKLSGVMYSRWEWNQAGAGATEKDANQFAIERVYVNVRGALSEDILFRATTDVYTVAGSDLGLATSTTTLNTKDTSQNLKSTSTTTSTTKNLNYMIQLKYAYFDWKASSWLTIRGGAQMSEWIDYMEGLWRYRGIAKVLTDDRGITSSSDLGLSAISKLPNKLGELQLCVYNGSGFRNAESNRFKDLAGRLVVTPLAEGGGEFKNLQVGARYYVGNTALNTSRSRFGAVVALPHDKFNIVAEFGSFSDGVASKADSVTKSSGMSIMGELKGNIINDDLGKLSLIFRYDSYNPNKDLTDAQRTSSALASFTKTIFGLSYKISNPVVFVLDMQSTKYSTANVLTKYDGTKTDTDTRIYGHFIVTL